MNYEKLAFQKIEYLLNFVGLKFVWLVNVLGLGWNFPWKYYDFHGLKGILMLTLNNHNKVICIWHLAECIEKHLLYNGKYNCDKRIQWMVSLMWSPFSAD